MENLIQDDETLVLEHEQIKTPNEVFEQPDNLEDNKKSLEIQQAQDNEKIERLKDEILHLGDKENSSENSGYLLMNAILNEAENIVPIRNKKGQLETEDGEVSSIQDESYWKIIHTPSFQSWNEGNAIKDKKTGEPMIVYHATNKINWEGLNIKTGEERGSSNLSFGAYFTSHKEDLSKFFSMQYHDWNVDAPEKYQKSIKGRFDKLINKEKYEETIGKLSKKKDSYLTRNEETTKFFSSFITIKNPLYIKSQDELYELGSKSYKEDLRKMGYDGIVVGDKNGSLDNRFTFKDQYIVFDEDQMLILPSSLESH